MRCNGTNECRSYLINGTFSSDASSFWAGVFFMCLIIIPFIFIVVQENILFSEESDVIKVLNNLDMWGISLLSLSLSLSLSSHRALRYELSANYQNVTNIFSNIFSSSQQKVLQNIHTSFRHICKSRIVRYLRRYVTNRHVMTVYRRSFLFQRNINN